MISTSMISKLVSVQSTDLVGTKKNQYIKWLPLIILYLFPYACISVEGHPLMMRIPKVSNNLSITKTSEFGFSSAQLVPGSKVPRWGLEGAPNLPTLNQLSMKNEKLKIASLDEEGSSQGIKYCKCADEEFEVPSMKGTRSRLLSPRAILVKALQTCIPCLRHPQEHVSRPTESVRSLEQAVNTRTERTHQRISKTSHLSQKEENQSYALPIPQNHSSHPKQVIDQDSKSKKSTQTYHHQELDKFLNDLQDLNQASGNEESFTFPVFNQGVWKKKKLN